MEIIFDLEKDFFELNPTFKIPFKGYDSDTMWVAALEEHKDSPFYNYTSQEKTKAISETFKDLNIDPLLRKAFNDFTLTKAQKFLKNWEIKLEEREDFIASMQYSEDTYEILDKMMGSTDKMWKQYLAILKQVEQENLSETLGNQEESLEEKGLI